MLKSHTTLIRVLLIPIVVPLFLILLISVLTIAAGALIGALITGLWGGDLKQEMTRYVEFCKVLFEIFTIFS